MTHSIDASPPALADSTRFVLRTIALPKDASPNYCYCHVVILAFMCVAGATIADDVAGRNQEVLILEFAFIDGPRQEIAITEGSKIDVTTSTFRGKLRVSGNVGRVVNNVIDVKLDVNWMLHNGGGGGPLFCGPVRLGKFQGGPAFRPAAVALSFLWIRRGTDPVPTLIEAMRHEDTAVSAARYLGGLGNAAKPAVLQLADALDPKHPTRLRQNAVEALGKIGPGAKAAVPRLTGLLQDEESASLRIRAAFALWQVAKEADATAALTAALNDSDLTVRLMALDSLSEIGAGAPSAGPALIAMLDDGDARIRASAAGALWATTRDSRAVDVLVQILKSGKTGYERAAQALERIGYPDAHRAAGALAVHVFTGREPSSYVTKALTRIDPDASQTIPVLLRVVRSNNLGNNQEAGSAALAGFGHTIVPRMRELLNAEDEPARDLAFYTLWRVGRPAVSTLAEALRHRDPEVREQAAAWLRDIGAGNSAAIPDLVRALGDDVEGVRVEAALTLTQIGPPAIAALKELLNRPDAATHERAHSVLREIQVQAEKN